MNYEKEFYDMGNGVILSSDEYWEMRRAQDFYIDDVKRKAYDEQKTILEAAREYGYMPFQEFADLAGVSVQAVYQRIKKNMVLAAYVYPFGREEAMKEEFLKTGTITEKSEKAGTKLIHKDATKFFARKTKQKEVDKVDEYLVKIQQLSSQLEQAALTIEAQKQQIETLEAEKQALLAKNEELQAIQLNLIDKLVASTLKQNELIENSQKLIAYQLQQLNQPAQVVEPEAEVIEVYKPKKGFFSKLFK